MSLTLTSDPWVTNGHLTAEANAFCGPDVVYTRKFATFDDSEIIDSVTRVA